MAVVVKNLLMFSVMILMLGVGLSTPFGQVLDVAKRYQLVMRGVLANFLVVPVVFYLALNWGPFRPDVVIGLLIMAAVPIAPMVPPFAGAAIISAVTVGALAVGNPNELIALTSLLALMVGVLFLIFGLLRLGWAANFLSQPVLQGFTQGIALIVIIGQVPKLFGTEATVAQLSENLQNVPHLIGLEVDYTGFFLQVWAVLATLGEANLSTTMVGLGALALLFALKRFWPLAPSALIAVILSVSAVSILGLAERGVGVIGEVETGMVSLSVPSVSMDKLVGLLPGAFAIVLLGYSVSLSVAAVGAEATGEEINPNQELMALGVANLGAAVSSGFVVCGSLSRGVVIRRAGGQTQVVSLINAALVLLTLLFVLPLFFNLPNATLAAVVIQAMLGLLNFD